jgi:hypothetical protein
MMHYLARLKKKGQYVTVLSPLFNRLYWTSVTFPPLNVIFMSG